MKQWVAFWTLGLIWGSSFLLIKVAVEELGALPLVATRLLISGSLMFLYLAFTGRRLPSALPDRLSILFVSIFNLAVPFTLITRAEEMIDSSVATVLNSTIPLMSLVLAHYLLHDERLTRVKVLGLLVGYGGIMVLMWRSLTDTEHSPIEGQLLMIAAVLSYAVSVIFMRARLRHVEPIVIAGSTLMLAACIMTPIALIFTAHLPNVGELELKTIFSIVTLATINTVIAYFLFYHLIDQWGARATMVSYLFPPVGITLGAVFLDEPVDARLLLGAALVLAGVFAVNYRAK